MPRVLVISDESTAPATGAVTLDEHVNSIHLDSEHSAWQFIERLGWAISDAETGEEPTTNGGAPPRSRPRRGEVTRSPQAPRRRAYA